MNSLQLKLIPHQTASGLPYQHLRLSITADDGILEPEDLRGLKLPENLDGSQGVVIEGKGPIWLYCYLTHECHATAWVGCYDPRYKGAVVVASHRKGVAVGEVLLLDLPS